jgi:hypothetical protein
MTGEITHTPPTVRGMRDFTLIILLASDLVWCGQPNLPLLRNLPQPVDKASS